MKVKSMASILSRALRFSVSVAFVFLFCFTSALAQTGSSAASTVGDVDGSQTPQSAAKGGDRLDTLRAQIASAKTNDERMRLQRVLVDYLVALNRKTEAVNELRAMERQERTDPVGFYNIGNALARLGDADTAMDAYRKAIKQRNGNYSRAQNNLGVLLLRQGRWDEARQAFLAALSLENFRYAEASYNLGRLYSTQGEANLAMREWSRALLAQPDHADAAIALARALAEDGKRERGLALLDAFIAHRAANPAVIEARRELLYGGDDVEPVSANAPSTATAAKSSGNKQSTQNNGGKASPSMRPLEVDQETYDLLERARDAREEGKSEEAITLYNRVLSRNNGLLPPANLELSFVLSGLKRYDEAVVALTTLTTRAGARYPIAYYHLGRQYEQLGKLGLAGDAYEKAAEAFNETNPQFLLDLSRVREKEGNTQAALAAMEDYVRISQTRGGAPAWSTERLAQLREKAKQN